MSQWDDVSYQHSAHGGARRKVCWGWECSNHRRIPSLRSVLAHLFCRVFFFFSSPQQSEALTQSAPRPASGVGANEKRVIHLPLRSSQQVSQPLSEDHHTSWCGGLWWTVNVDYVIMRGGGVYSRLTLTAGKDTDPINISFRWREGNRRRCA